MTTKSLMKPETSFPSHFDKFFRPGNELSDSSRDSGSAAMVLAVNIAENDAAYQLSLTAPGLKNEDFRINVREHVLTIIAEKEVNEEEKDEQYMSQEYNYSFFLRRFPMPEKVQQEAIEARYEDGILNVLMPKKEVVRKAYPARQIPIK